MGEGGGSRLRASAARVPAWGAALPGSRPTGVERAGQRSQRGGGGLWCGPGTHFHHVWSSRIFPASRIHPQGQGASAPHAACAVGRTRLAPRCPLRGRGSARRGCRAGLYEPCSDQLVADPGASGPTPGGPVSGYSCECPSGLSPAMPCVDILCEACASGSVSMRSLEVPRAHPSRVLPEYSPGAGKFL